MKEQVQSNQIYVVMDSSREAEIALARIEAAGVPRKAITLLSSEPIHFDSPGHETGKRSLIGTFGVIGGIVGGALAIGLTVWTSRQVNMITGGMPIVSPWALAVIVFEMTALGAILTCLGRMIFEARLVQKARTTGVDEALAAGKVVLTMEPVEASHRQIAERVLGRCFLEAN